MHGLFGWARSRRGWSRLLAAALLIAVLVVIVLRVPAAAHDFSSAFAHLRPSHLPWLIGAVAAEFVAFYFYARIQAQLLRAGGRRVHTWLLLRLSIASSGLRALLPAGALPSSGWLYEQYRHVEIPPSLSLYVVLASGFVSTVTLLGLLLVGVAIAGITSAFVIALSGAVLVVGSAGFVAATHRLGSIVAWLAPRRSWLARIAHAGLQRVAGVTEWKPGWRAGARCFLDAAGNLLADIVCLLAAFSVLGQPVPWSGLLFAYTASQLAGSIVPLPGGLGAVEGGLVGALHLSGVNAGDALAVAIVYRVITYWGIAMIGGIELAHLARHPPSRSEVDVTAPHLSGGGEASDG